MILGFTDSVEHTCSILHRTSDVTLDKSQKSSVADIITRPVETIETQGIIQEKNCCTCRTYWYRAIYIHNVFKFIDCLFRV